MLKRNKGFTLIELLVVIAIIGILSSVVLASLNTARTKGADAAIKANLAGIRAQAEILYDTHGAYGVDSTPTAFVEGVCAATLDTLFFDSTISSQITAAAKASTGGGIGVGRCVVTTGGAAWAVSVPLKGVPANAWCVDSNGASTQVLTGDTGITAAGACLPN